jgi:hypothetical protein
MGRELSVSNRVAPLTQTRSVSEEFPLLRFELPDTRIKATALAVWRAAFDAPSPQRLSLIPRAFFF